MKNKLSIFVLGISALCFSACKDAQNQNNLPKDKTVFFLGDSEDRNFNPYTDVQKNYLDDTYDSISKYGNGAAENSKPLKYKLEWQTNDFDGKYTFTKFEIQLIREKDGSIVRQYEVDNNTYSLELDNLEINTDYIVRITSYNGSQELSSNQISLSVEDKQVRFINIDGLSNVRDCGGWETVDGKRIKQGLLYRGEELNQQNYGKNGNGTIDEDSVERAKEKPYGQKITQKGIDTFVNELNIKCEVDIRGYENFDWQTNINPSPTECGGLSEGNGIIQDIKYTICPVHTNRDKIYYDDYGKAAVKNFFSLLANQETNLPLYFHCAQGKDRTGFLAYLFEAFLGVPEENLMRDYLLSNLGKTGSVSILKLVGSSAQYNYVDYLNGNEVSTQGSPKVTYRAEGDTIAKRAYNYLISCGLTENQLEAIQETFIEEN